MAGPTTIQDFERLVDEARREVVLSRSGEHRVASPRPHGPEPNLTLGNYGLTAVDRDVRRRRELALPVSVVLHTAGAVALAIVPLLVVDALPEPGGGIRAFFVEPMAAPPPPPPPPPPPAARSAVAARVAPKPAAVPAGFVAPVEVPSEIKPEEGLDLGVDGGVPGGVEGGVPGGVVGGVVGGLPDAPPPPPVKPVRVGGDIREPRRVLYVPPVYPKLAVQAGVQGTVIIEATLDARGRVTTTTILRSIPILDDAALEAVRQWAYTPTLLNGVPTPVILVVTVNFHLKPGA